MSATTDVFTLLADAARELPCARRRSPIPARAGGDGERNMDKCDEWDFSHPPLRIADESSPAARKLAALLVRCTQIADQLDACVGMPHNGAAVCSNAIALRNAIEAARK